MSGNSDRLDEDVKQLLAVILEFAALTRRDEPREREGSSLGLGRAMRRHGLGTRHASALLSVALYGPMTVTQLAQRHRVLVKTASLVAIQLEKARLVERKADPLDRRRTLLTIPGGKKRVVEAGLQKRAAPLRRALTRLSGAERDGLIKGLKLLVLEMTGASRRAC